MLGSEALKLMHRLALTRRYLLSGLPTTDQLKQSEAYCLVGEHCAAASAEIGNTQPDFLAFPPSLTLLREAIDLLEELSTECPPGSNHTALAIAARMLFDSLGNDVYVQNVDVHQLLTQLDLSDDKLASSECSSSSGNPAPGWKLLTIFISLLMQQSYRSFNEGASFRETRALHMADSATLHLNKAQMTVDRPVCMQAAKLTFELANSGDFEVMFLGLGSVSHTLQQHASTAAMLRIRLMLRSEPFFVHCSGTAHISAFLKLARWTQLHLELMPTLGHVKRMQEIFGPEKKGPLVLDEVLLEVSCSPQSECAYQLSTITHPDVGFYIPADIVHMCDCEAMAAQIRSMRKNGLGILIQSRTRDLTKVLLVLYLELLTSHKAIHLMAVGCESRRMVHTAPLHEAGYLQVLVETAVDPLADSNFRVDELHHLLIL